MNVALLVFARPPRTGRVKTRLAASLGPRRAATVYTVMLEAALQQARASGLPLTLCLTEAPDGHCWQPPAGVRWELQVGASLGQRMRNAFGRRFADGFAGAVLVGSDVPTLSAACLREALEALARTPVVIGPAQDGGFWLLGQRKPGWDLFTGVPYSSPSTLATTLARCRALGLGVTLLETHADVDSEADLWRALADPRLPPPLRARLAAACNESSALETNAKEESCHE